MAMRGERYSTTGGERYSTTGGEREPPLRRGGGMDGDREILDIIPARYDADSDSRMARRNAQTRLILTISLAVLAVMALGVAARHILFGDTARERQGSIPIIHADDRPIKVKPQDRGGMDVPNQDKLIYERMGAKSNEQAPEQLLPPPEQAQTPPEPKTATPSPVPAPVQEQAPAVKSAASGGTLPAAPQKPAPLPAPTPAPVAKPASAPPPPVVKGGGWVVQLGAVHGDGEAQTEWNRLKSAHRDLLGALSPDIVRVDLGAKGIFWRVRGGPLEEAQARMLCSQLEKQAQGCIVARK